MKISFNFKTDIGQVRSVNQDSALCDSESNIFIVADGMGGHAGGEIASKMCIETVLMELQRKDSNSEIDTAYMSLKLADSINLASTKIFEKALEDADLKGMGTTATAIQIVENEVYCGHVGDSRLYLLRAGFIYQITTDHSLVSEQLHAGVITEEEAENHHLKNVITRSVGYQEEEHVDFFHFTLEPQDYLLLCSDGLYNKISDRELSILIKNKGCASIDELVDIANQRGGEDNITAVVISIE